MCALGGAFLISGVIGGEFYGYTGVVYGIIAATLYASIMILNKKIKDISGIERTFIQLSVSFVVMLVYVLCTVDVSSVLPNPKEFAILLVLGVVHTGVVYVLFFSAVGNLPAQSASIITYADPISAILFSVIFLNQGIDLLQSVGSVLVIGSALVNELVSNKNNVTRT